jgi:glycosyltransferase involved in cell wall biosynthesis
MTTSVSIVIPARNEPDYSAHALRSVAEQRASGVDLECVVVDNGSTDATVSVVRAFQTATPGLPITLISEPEPGIARAKNRGAAAARGDVLLFLDADSWMEQGLVCEVVGQYQMGKPAGSIRVAADSIDPLEQLFFWLTEVGKVLFGIRAQMLYCDRQLFQAVGGFREELLHAEDLDLLHRVRALLGAHGRSVMPHVRRHAIMTSTRRLQGGRFRSRLMLTFGRWLLASVGIGREWEY